MVITGLNVVFMKNNSHVEYYDLMLKCGKIIYILRRIAHLLKIEI